MSCDVRMGTKCLILRIGDSLCIRGTVGVREEAESAVMNGRGAG